MALSNSTLSRGVFTEQGTLTMGGDGEITNGDYQINDTGIELKSDGGDHITWRGSFGSIIDAGINFNSSTNQLEMYSNDDLVISSITNDIRITAGTEVFINGTDVDIDCSNLGFYGATPVSKQTLSGSSFGGSQVLKDLVIVLEDLGLITNNTTP